jgi:L-malate glycosyltransferase
MNDSLRHPLLLHVFSNFVPTGPELRTARLMGELGGEFRHAVLSMDGRTGAAERIPPGVDFRILPSPPKAGSLATALRLRRILRDERPDLVLTYNWGAFDMLLAAGLARFHPVIHHEEGFNQDEAERFKLRRVLARRAVLPRADAVVVPSRRLEEVARRVWRLPESRLRLIPNGVDPAEYGPADGHPELRRRLGLPEDAVVAGSVGQIRPVKNYERLLEACARAGPSVHLLLVGDGEGRPRLEARAAAPDLAGRVHFAGYQADPAPFYRAMDVFCVSSDSEQMPVCLLEAMATGLPVAATDVGDLRFMLPKEQHAALSPLADGAQGLGRRIAELAASAEPRRRLGALNRRRVEESFSLSGMCAAYREAYHCALCGDGAGRPRPELPGLVLE